MNQQPPSICMRPANNTDLLAKQFPTRTYSRFVSPYGTTGLLFDVATLQAENEVQTMASRPKKFAASVCSSTQIASLSKQASKQASKQRDIHVIHAIGKAHMQLGSAIPGGVVISKAFRFPPWPILISSCAVIIHPKRQLFPMFPVPLKNSTTSKGFSTAGIPWLKYTRTTRKIKACVNSCMIMRVSIFIKYNCTHAPLAFP